MKKIISNALLIGLRNLLRQFKFVWLFWLTNVAFSIALTLPITYLLSEDLIRSSAAAKLIYDFDYIWFLQFFRKNESAFLQLPYWIYGASGIYALIQLFYIGGITAIFHNPRKNHFVDFFYGGVKFWFRFFKIFLLSLFFYYLFFQLVLISENLIKENIEFMNSKSGIIFSNIFFFLANLFFIGIVSMYSDYFKIFVALQDRWKIIKTIPVVTNFIIMNFFPLFIVFIIVAIIGGIGALIYNIIASFLPRYTIWFFILSFILQQLLIIFRFAVKVYFYSSAIYLYKELNAEIMEEEVEEI